MTTADWNFIKTLAREKRVTLSEAGVRRNMTLGQAIDWVLDTAES